jgi:hypothetical protein
LNPRSAIPTLHKGTRRANKDLREQLRKTRAQLRDAQKKVPSPTPLAEDQGEAKSSTE